MTSADLSVLYLHGGPGLTAELERRRFGTTLPVLWWDQPRAGGAADPFQQLVDAAVAQVERLAAARGNPVALLASSFGAFLAAALLARIPERIGAVTVSGGILDLRVSLVRLGRLVARDRSDGALEAACRSAAETESFEAFWMLVGRIGAVPQFWSYYFSPAAVEQRAAMNALAAERPLIDLATCEAVTRSIRRMPPMPESSSMGRPFRILLGRHDPLVAPEDAGAWKRRFPAANVELVETGHFPHLELPPAAWLPVEGAAGVRDAGSLTAGTTPIRMTRSLGA